MTGGERNSRRNTGLWLLVPYAPPTGALNSAFRSLSQSRCASRDSHLTHIRMEGCLSGGPRRSTAWLSGTSRLA